MAKLIALMMLLVALAGCQHPRVAGDFCDVSEPHRHSAEAQAAMTDKELATETKHNEYGEKRCGWKP
jgi:hypothetical protein